MSMETNLSEDPPMRTISIIYVVKVNRTAPSVPFGIDLLGSFSSPETDQVT